MQQQGKLYHLSLWLSRSLLETWLTVGTATCLIAVSPYKGALIKTEIGTWSE